MDVEDSFSRLPATHAAALRLQARGRDHDAIAVALLLQIMSVAAACGELVRDSAQCQLLTDTSAREVTVNKLLHLRDEGQLTKIGV